MRAWVIGLAIVALAGVATVGCASGKSTPGDAGSGDSGVDADASGGADGGDAGSADSGTEDSGGGEDAGSEDAATPERSGTCEACETHDDCRAGSYCVSLSVGGKACVPGCNPDIPDCPRAFNCVLDVASGVDTHVCLPVGGACCVDEDADGYGQGIGCMGEDCDDEDETTNPGTTEVCDGADNDCDEETDEPPTDCVSGRCADRGDGTYEAVEGADCMDAMCLEGTLTDCGEYTCQDGGEIGNACADSCTNSAGEDDETFCIETAHCDDGTCVPDEPNGDECDEDNDCESGHCDNGYCCDDGTCCNTVADCPGGGAETFLCESTSTCQGTRSETTCESFQCVGDSGIDDDRGCDDTTKAKDCGLFVDKYCNGAEIQGEPFCETTCTVDDECKDGAHCEGDVCAPDRGPGGSCTRPEDCMDGLFCADGFCCDTACGGDFESCGLAGTEGTCSCSSDSFASSCAAATDLGDVNPGDSLSRTGIINDTTGGGTQTDWFSVNFPTSGRPGAGTPTIRLDDTFGTPSNFEMSFDRMCGEDFSCGMGSHDMATEFTFVDNESFGSTAYSSHTTAWPTLVVFSVTRVVSTTDCDEKSYRIIVSR